MTFLLTLLYIWLLYVRPLDLVEGFENLPVMVWLGVTTLVLTVVGWGLTPAERRPSLGEPQVWMVVTFVFFAICPWLLIGWSEEAQNSLGQLQPMLGAFFMVLLNVNSMKRMRQMVFVLVAAFTVMTAQGITSYYTGWRHDTFIMDQRRDDTPDDSVEVIQRLRHIGFLNDPNDFAHALVTLLPLLALGWRPEKRLVKYGVILPLGAAFFWAIVLTRSRGGLVAVAVTTMLGLRDRMGREKAAILTGLLVTAFIMFNFGAGRAFNDESASNRIEAWASGILILRSNPLGVGFNGFVEAHRGLTAHNTFVLTFAETGLLGYFFWMALLVMTYTELTRLVNLPGDTPEIHTYRRWARLLRLALSAFLAGAYFLSRTYVVTLYLLIALGSCLKQIAARDGHAIEKVSTGTWTLQALKWEGLSIFAVWLSVKLAGA